MTVSTTDSVEEYVSGGPAFPIPYRFLQNSDIEAVLVHQDGTSETLTLGTQYTLTGAGSQSGGTLTSSYAAGILAAPGAVLTISRIMDAVQPTDLRNQGRFLAETHETVFDRLTMLIQQGFAGLSRALLRPVGKNYYDAEGRQIKNLGDPTENQDATPKKWVNDLIASILATGQGPINNAANVIFTGANGFIGVVQDLAASNGADLVGYRSETVESALDNRIAVFSIAAYGASPTASSSENRAAIQAAADAALAAGGVLQGIDGAELSVDATLQINCHCDMSRTVISADSSTVSPVVRVGPVTAPALVRMDVKLPKIRNSSKPADGWAGAQVGLELANVNTSKIYIPEVSGFGTGLRCSGYGTGFSYNEVTLGFVYGNKVNIYLKPGNATGWCNENNFYGGRLSHNTTDTTDWSGTRCILLERFGVGSGNGAPNNNVFHKPSVESDYVEFMFDVWGAFNLFLSPRYEGSQAKVRLYSGTSGETTGNLFLGGYASFNLQFTYAGLASPRNSLITGLNNYVEGTGALNTTVCTSGDSEAFPHYQGFLSSQQALSKSSASTDWTYRIYSLGLSGKRGADAAARCNVDWNNGRVYFGDGTAAPTKYVGNLGSSIGANANFVPLTTNTYSLGVSGITWSTAYLQAAPVVGSDERIKQQITDVDDLVLDAVDEIGVKRYKLNDEVEKLGDRAPWHFGVLAQDIVAAFQARGLNALDYALLVYAEWGAEPEILDDDGNVVQPGREAGQQYSVRYSELEVLKSAAALRAIGRLQ